MGTYKQAVIRVAVVLVLLAGLAISLVPQLTAVDNVQAAQDAATAKGAITVVGKGTAVGQPDQAQAQVGVETFAPTIEEATNKNEEAIQEILTALQAEGIAPEDIQTTNFNLWVEQSYDEQGPSGIVGYHVSNQVNIIIKELDNAGDVLAAAINAGANNVFGLTFTVSDPIALEAEARAKAMDDALYRATDLAKLGQVELGEITIISEVTGQGAVPFFGKGGDMAMSETAAPSPSIAPGQLSYEVQIQVTYSIK